MKNLLVLAVVVMSSNLIAGEANYISIKDLKIPALEYDFGKDLAKKDSITRDILFVDGEIASDKVSSWGTDFAGDNNCRIQLKYMKADYLDKEYDAKISKFETSKNTLNIADLFYTGQSYANYSYDTKKLESDIQAWIEVDHAQFVDVKVNGENYKVYPRFVSCKSKGTSVMGLSGMAKQHFNGAIILESKDKAAVDMVKALSSANKTLNKDIAETSDVNDTNLRSAKLSVSTNSTSEVQSVATASK